jgi:hypothetical protein
LIERIITANVQKASYLNVFFFKSGIDLAPFFSMFLCPEALEYEKRPAGG